MCRPNILKDVPDNACSRAEFLIEKRIESGKKSFTDIERKEHHAFDDVFDEIYRDVPLADIVIPDVIKKYFV